jgi:uncharacterized protein
MLIEVSQIPPDGLDIKLPEGSLELGAPSELWSGPAIVQAELHLGRSGRGVVISGSFSGGVELLCSRCLEPFPFTIEERFHLYCGTAGQGRLEGEHELADADLDVTYLDQGRINTDDLLRENLLLSLPVQPLCREECRGLCLHCGANLNRGSCGCAESRVDPRFHVLRRLL